MTSRNFDYELLLQPIDSDAPAGESLRYDPLYDRIASARLQEPALSQGVWQRATQQADWHLVEDLCCTALATRSKDLQIGVWLTEAWLHLYGLPGFTAGCNLIYELHKLYLLQLIPAPALSQYPDHDRIPLPLDSSDPAIEHRLNMLQWMNDKLSIQIKLIPLTSPVEGSEAVPVSLADLEAALHSNQAARRQGTPQEAKARDAGLTRSLQLTPKDHITETWKELQQAARAIDKLSDALDRFYGESNGGLLRIREVLHEMALAISPALPQQTFAPPEPIEENILMLTSPENALQKDHASPSSPGLPMDAVSTINTREQAYEALAQIAEFLARLEPHSPVPYLLQRAIAWGNMSLRELLPELLHDQAALKDVGHLLRFDGGGATSNAK